MKGREFKMTAVISQSKRQSFSDEQKRLMQILKRTAGSVKLNHSVDSVQVIKELRGQIKDDK